MVENACILEAGGEQEFKASLIYMRLSVKMKKKKKKNLSPDRRGLKEKNEKQRQNISKAGE